MRDGRDIAFGELRAVTSILCATFFGNYSSVHSMKGNIKSQIIASSVLGQVCSAVGAPQLVAWALLNLAIFDEALRTFGPDRYFPLRIEDVAFVDDPSKTILNVLNFVETVPKDKKQNARIAAAIAARVKGSHAAAYGGNKFSPFSRRQKLTDLGLLEGNHSKGNRDTSVVIQALRHFGYRADDWGIVAVNQPYNKPKIMNQPIGLA